MSSAPLELRGKSPRIVLPVTLSPVARRGALVTTGIDPEPRQTYVVADLVHLDHAERKRLLDLWDKVHVSTGDPADPDWMEEDLAESRTTSYLWLHRGIDDRWTRYLPGTEGEGVDLDEVFYVKGPQTVAALDAFREQLAPDEQDRLAAMLAGAPLVDALDDATALSLDEVMTAYERALELAERLIAFVDAGTVPPPFDGRPFRFSDEGVFLVPMFSNDDPLRMAAILRATSSEAYDEAVDLLRQMDELGYEQGLREKLDRTCYHWWKTYADRPDTGKVSLLRTDLSNLTGDVRTRQQAVVNSEEYEQGRSDWIARHGSQRLKRAAERGYKHDGAYRDERLEIELPGFVGSLGRKPEIKELVNPSGEALDLESEALARAESLGIPAEQVRLVFAQTGANCDWYDGEFVQIEGYLGRHTVWQSVSGRKTTDVPF